MAIFKKSVILFSLCMFHSTLTETGSMCKGNLPPVKYVAQRSNVTVHCPTLRGSEMGYSLYKGPDLVTSIYIKINNTLFTEHSNSPNRYFPAHISVNFTDNSTSFVLFNVTVNMTALYKCEAEKNFPPPFEKVEQVPQTIVFVEETSSQQLCQHVSYLVLFLVFGGIYGLVASSIVIILRIKLSQVDCNGLKNIKFRECRQKWQGVQHPVQKGFYIETIAQQAPFKSSNQKAMFKKEPTV
ncbi:T-cell-specific surface glycoprotein CD28 homolog [Misgurnus anguillicaudatus]|uniref:T-cell-specific surface glycoprotein CD28 homolog n=1 Tax=Misgurnus anguillicaudatus TaxID=75329 RepID=UPI003CCF9808